MDKIERMFAIANIFRHWFKKDTAKDSYLAFKALHYERLYDLITAENCKTPEKAFQTMNHLLGQKSLFQQIKAQYEMNIAYKG